jgi:hypothetical protein
MDGLILGFPMVAGIVQGEGFQLLKALVKALDVGDGDNLKPALIDAFHFILMHDHLLVKYIVHFFMRVLVAFLLVHVSVSLEDAAQVVNSGLVVALPNCERLMMMRGESSPSCPFKGIHD